MRCDKQRTSIYPTLMVIRFSHEQTWTCYTLQASDKRMAPEEATAITQWAHISFRRARSSGVVGHHTNKSVPLIQAINGGTL